MKDEMPEIKGEQSADDAFRLLQALGGKRHMTLIKTDNPLMGFWVDPDDATRWSQNWADIADLNSDGWNIYYSPNPVRLDFEGAKASKRDVLNVTTLYADFDPDACLIKSQGCESKRGVPQCIRAGPDASFRRSQCPQDVRAGNE